MNAFPARVQLDVRDALQKDEHDCGGISDSTSASSARLADGNVHEWPSASEQSVPFGDHTLGHLPEVMGLLGSAGEQLLPLRGMAQAQFQEVTPTPVLFELRDSFFEDIRRSGLTVLLDDFGAQYALVGEAAWRQNQSAHLWYVADQVHGP